MTAVDVSRRAVATVRFNARLNGVQVDVRRGELLQPVGGEHFEVITANPPYLPSAGDSLPGRARAHHTEAGPSGRIVLDRIIAAAPIHLAPGGALLVVHSSLNGEDETLAAMRAAGLVARVVERRSGPLGPLLAARADWLEANGLLRPGQRTEELLVVAGARPSG